MPSYRLTDPARSDLRGILRESLRLWGPEGRRRYETTIAAGIRRVAAEPEGMGTRDEEHIVARVRSFPLRNLDAAHRPVKRPVHVIYYTAEDAGMLVILRVLHERMDAPNHLRGPNTD